jgi:hypothetical protein
MTVNHGLLNWMEYALGRLQACHRDDVGAVELIEELDTSIDRFKAEALAFGSANKDRANPTIAFRADDLGPGQLQLFAEKLGQ